MRPCRRTRVGNKVYELGAEGCAGLRNEEEVQRRHFGGWGNKSHLAEQYKDNVGSSCAPSDTTLASEMATVSVNELFGV